jgi:hypothetical protein
MIKTARIPSSPPAFHCLASDGRSSQATAFPVIRMSFLQKSDLKKHLSAKNGLSTTTNLSPLKAQA